MSSTKVQIRFFTIADFKEEENWLREQNKAGWKLTKMVPPCAYYFEACQPEDVIYRLDYKNNKENPDYMQMAEDFGWEYCGKCFGWIYFRKRAADAVNENDGELFSDNASRCDMIMHIMKTRLLPVALIFLCCVIPNTIRACEGRGTVFISGLCLLMCVIYVWLLAHCGWKLRMLKKELEE